MRVGGCGVLYVVLIPTWQAGTPLHPVGFLSITQPADVETQRLDVVDAFSHHQVLVHEVTAVRARLRTKITPNLCFAFVLSKNEWSAAKRENRLTWCQRVIAVLLHSVKHVRHSLSVKNLNQINSHNMKQSALTIIHFYKTQKPQNAPPVPDYMHLII